MLLTLGFANQLAKQTAAFLHNILYIIIVRGIEHNLEQINYS